MRERERGERVGERGRYNEIGRERERWRAEERVRQVRERERGERVGERGRYKEIESAERRGRLGAKERGRERQSGRQIERD